MKITFQEVAADREHSLCHCQTSKIGFDGPPFSRESIDIVQCSLEHSGNVINILTHRPRMNYLSKKLSIKVKDNSFLPEIETCQKAHETVKTDDDVNDRD